MSRAQGGKEEEEYEEEEEEELSAGESWPVGKKTVSRKKINGKMITLPANLVGLPPGVIVAAANMAIARLGTMVGQTGSVVILSFSHTVILGKIINHKSKPNVRDEIVKNVVQHGTLSREPESMGLTLETM